MAKEVHSMIHCLQTDMTTLHRISSSVTACRNCQPHVVSDTSNELHQHRETISHPACSCSGMSSHSRGPVFLQSSSSACLHLCSSEREGNATNRLQNQNSPCHAQRATPSSPYMTQSQGGPSLLGISSAFRSFPVNQGLAHPSIRIQTHTDVAQNLTSPQTPTHSLNTPASQPQYHTAFSSLTPTGNSTSMSTVHDKRQQSSVRQNDPVGSSPVRHSQEHACALPGQQSDRARSLHHETKDHADANGADNRVLELQK